MRREGNAPSSIGISILLKCAGSPPNNSVASRFGLCLYIVYAGLGDIDLLEGDDMCFATDRRSQIHRKPADISALKPIFFLLAQVASRFLAQ